MLVSLLYSNFVGKHVETCRSRETASQDVKQSDIHIRTYSQFHPKDEIHLGPPKLLFTFILASPVWAIRLQFSWTLGLTRMLQGMHLPPFASKPHGYLVWIVMVMQLLMPMGQKIIYHISPSKAFSITSKYAVNWTREDHPWFVL